MVVRQSCRFTAQDIMRKIKEDVESYIGGKTYSDDITLMIIKAT